MDEVDLKEKEIRKQSFNLIKQQFQTKTETESQDKETLLVSFFINYTVKSATLLKSVFHVI